MQIAIWIIIGIVAAAIARGIMRERSFGLLGDLMLGLLGAIVGGWVFHALGFNSPHDLLRHAFVSLVGAVVVLGLARWLRPVVRETEKLLGGTGEATDLETHIRRHLELIVPTNSLPSSFSRALRNAASAAGPGIASKGMRAHEAS